ncbi:hypothetical protein JTY60_02005 [symbiont of Argiope bruennichi]|uniref:hypothetical protein n=1 Tax=symbiont of Argiope bruennichi TaxID=2810479 RepID=UPI003DA3C979
MLFLCKNILKIALKKIFITGFFAVIGCELTVAFIYNSKSKGTVPWTEIQRFPDENEINVLKQDIVNKLNTQYQILFNLQPKLRVDNFIHLSFPVGARFGGAYIDFLDRFVNPALEWSRFYHVHFLPWQQGYEPLACYPGGVYCDTIDTKFVIDGDFWSIHDLIDFVTKLKTDIDGHIFYFYYYKINVWNDFIKGALTNFLNNTIVSLPISDSLKKALKDKVEYYSNPDHLIDLLKNFDPDSLYNFSVKDWNTFANKGKNISTNDIQNIKYRSIGNNNYLLTFNLNLIPQGFLSLNNKDIANFDNQVTYSFEYKNNKFILKDGMVAKNFFYNIFLQALNFV